MTVEDRQGGDPQPRTEAGRNFLVEVDAAAYRGGGFSVSETLARIIAIEDEIRAAADSRPAELDAVTERVKRYMEESDDAWTFRGIASAAILQDPDGGGVDPGNGNHDSSDESFEPSIIRAAADSRPAELDAAWAEAEAALPDKRWSIWISGNWEDGWEAEYTGSKVVKTNDSGWFHDPGDLPSPAAALRALAARLASTEADQAETPGPRTCAECGEVWPCEATVRGFDKKTPHRLASTEADQADRHEENLGVLGRLGFGADQAETPEHP